MHIVLPLNENELLFKLRSSDETAFEQLYHTYSLRIFKKLLRLVKDEEIAKELLQDVFFKVWEKRASIDIDKSFRSYLYTIAQNLVTDLYRRAAHDRKLLAHLVDAAMELYNPVEDHINSKDNKAMLQRALDSLPPQRKKIYILCKIEGKTYEEVSELLGISTSTISDHIVKGTKTLKNFFASNELAVIIVTAAFISAL